MESLRFSIRYAKPYEPVIIKPKSTITALTMLGDIAPIIDDTIGRMLDKVNPPPVTAPHQPANYPRCKDYNGPYGDGSNVSSY